MRNNLRQAVELLENVCTYLSESGAKNITEIIWRVDMAL